MLKNQKNRIIRVIKQEIETLDLNLNGFNVITELGSNGYMLGPIIANLAGAKKVTTLTKDSFFGNSEDIIKNFKTIFFENVNQKSIKLKKKLSDSDYIEADIVTNTGFIRPINTRVIDKLNPSSVIPLMYDKWEIRKDDIDILTCTNKGIKVSGTNESLGKYPIFDFCGILATKMVLENGFEIKENNIIVWSGDNFGSIIKKQFEDLGAKKVVMTNDFTVVLKNIHDLDFILIADYEETREYGTKSFFDFVKLKELNLDISFIHLYGNINYDKLKEKQLNIYPMKNGYSKKMTFALDHVGIIPLIKLITASFKVAECLLRGEKNELVQEVNCFYDGPTKCYKTL